MAQTRAAAPTARHFLLLFLLSVAWGTAFLFIKLALEAMSPVAVNLGRMGVAALVLALLVRARRLALPPVGRTWLYLIAVAVFGNVLPYWLIAVAEVQVESGLASILIGATPLVTMVLAHFATRDERLTVGRIAGFLMGFAGLIVLFGPELHAGIGDDVLAQGLLLLACVSFALTALIARRMPPVPVPVASFGMSVIGTVMLFPFAVGADPDLVVQPSLLAIGAIVGLGVISTAAAMLVYFTLVREVSATFVVTANYLTPLVALSGGVLLLGERPGMNALVAFVLICIGIWLANRKGW